VRGSLGPIPSTKKKKKKKDDQARWWWLMLVSLATQEVEIRIIVGSQPRQIV
jgi:hypothetical protein